MSDEAKIGTGSDPKGAAVEYFKNEAGLVIVKAAGVKVTHSDTVEHLQSIGYKVELFPEPEPPKSDEVLELEDELKAAKERIELLLKEKASIEAYAKQLEAIVPADKLEALQNQVPAPTAA